MQLQVARYDPLSSARGVFVAMLISAALWYGLAVFGGYILHSLAVLFSIPMVVKTSIYLLVLVVVLGAVWTVNASGLSSQRGRRGLALPQVGRRDERGIAVGAPGGIYTRCDASFGPGSQRGTNGVRLTLGKARSAAFATLNPKSRQPTATSLQSDRGA